MPINTNTPHRPTYRSPENVRKTQEWDNETLVRGKDENETVDHIASAKENLKAIPTDIKSAFDPSDKLRGMWGKTWVDVPAFIGIELALKAAITPAVVLVEAADFVLAPAKITKDLGDAAVHGILAGVKALKK